MKNGYPAVRGESLGLRWLMRPCTGKHLWALRSLLTSVWVRALWKIFNSSHPMADRISPLPLFEVPRNPLGYVAVARDRLDSRFRSGLTLMLRPRGRITAKHSRILPSQNYLANGKKGSCTND